jgi:hypothetical protein
MRSRNVSLAEQLFRVEPRIRYVAINQSGLVVEMMQSPTCPTLNSAETDRLEELIVNPIVLEITRRRGEIDVGGTRFVVIRYGSLYQVIMPYRAGHVSLSVELHDDPLQIAEKVGEYLNRLSEHYNERSGLRF